MTVLPNQREIKLQWWVNGVGHWWPVCLVAIILVGALFRLSYLSLMEFRHDSAYWALEAFRILQRGYLPLVGQQVGSVQVELYNGPILSYISALIFAVLGYKPIFVTIFIATCNVAGILFTFLLGKQLYSREVGLIAALLMSISPWLVLYGRMYWPQALFPSLIPLSFLVLVLGIQKHKLILFILYGLLLGIGLQLHLSVIALVGTGILYLFFYSHRRILSPILLSIGVVIGYLPIILFDITHGFVNLNGLLHLPSLHAVDEPRVFHFLKTLWNFENVLSGQALWTSKLSDIAYLPGMIDWGQGILFTVIFLLALAMMLAENFRGKSIKQALKFSYQEALLVLFILLPTGYLFFSRSLIQRHYFLFLYPIPFLIIAKGFMLGPEFLARKNINSLLHWIAPVILIFAGMLNIITIIYGFNFLMQSGGEGEYGTVLNDKQGAVDFILNHSNGAYEVNIENVQESLPYVFLFKAQDNITVKGREDMAKAIYSISISENSHQYSIIESKYYTGSDLDHNKILYKSRGVIVMSDWSVSIFDVKK
jgi:4-amino-4-deoxy-L-arabinose transferase-like glycosyltransferase